MTFMHYVGAALVLLLITALGWLSGKRVLSAEDFYTGSRKAGAGIVAGSLAGSLAGGASTVGTAQLAFTHGIAAWWYTLGAGIGCVVLCCVFTKPFYASGISTLPRIFAREYGERASTAATVLTSAGNFLTVAAQVLAGVALVSAVSGAPAWFSGCLVVALMLAYVVFGGVWGTGIVGMLKSALLALAIGGCALLALYLEGGLQAFTAQLPKEQFFSLFSRGVARETGAVLSVIVGLVSTQAYFQSVICARSLKLSRAGALLCAAFMPVIGAAGVLVGLYMRIHHPEISPGAALPLFILEKLPPLLAGTVLATLLVTLVGTGAGISLGISSMFCNDIYKVYINRNADDRTMLFAARVIVVVVLCLSLATLVNPDSLILNWTFLSMGLRGAVCFAPLCATLFFPGRVSAHFALISMLAAPVGMVLGKILLPAGLDPLFPGIAASLCVLLLGVAAGNKKLRAG